MDDKYNNYLLMHILINRFEFHYFCHQFYRQFSRRARANSKEVRLDRGPQNRCNSRKINGVIVISSVVRWLVFGKHYRWLSSRIGHPVSVMSSRRLSFKLFLRLFCRLRMRAYRYLKTWFVAKVGIN